MDLTQAHRIGRIIFYGICLLALMRGNRPLRMASTAIFAGALLAPVARVGQTGDQPLYGVILVDLTVLIALSFLLLSYKRWWLVSATGCFLMGLLTHIAALIGAPVSLAVTDTARLMWTYAMVVALGWGWLQHERDRRGAHTKALGDPQA